MRFAVLGPLRVERAGVDIAVGGPRQRDLLVLLLLRANRVLTADWLADALWDGRPPAGAAVTLRSHVAGLRRVLEPERGHRVPAELLRGHTGGYELAVPPDAVDAVRFTTLADDAAAAMAAGDTALAEHRYREALGLWRGDVAVDLAAVRADVEGLAGTRLEVEEGLATAAVALGRHHEVLPALRRFVTEHPEREHARGQLMLALYRAGRQAEALEVYDEGRRVLRDEHGVPPGEPLRLLHQRILAQDVPAAAPPVRVAPRPAGGRAGVRLVGRERELALLDGVLDAARHAGGRFAAVVGEAGIGKTSLARAVGARAAAAGTPVVWARCPDIGQTPPFWLWTQVVRALSPDGVAPALAGFTGPFAAGHADRVDPAARFRAYEAVAALVHTASADAGLVLVLDDLHAADPDSLLLLRYLAPTLHTSRALVVATLRPYAHEPDVVAALADVARSPGHRRVHPAGLDAEAVADLVREHTGGTPSAADVARLVTRTGGNPFFLTELLTSPEDPPPGVRDTVRRRLHALDADTRDCLDLLSVAGRDLDVAVVGSPSPAADHLVTETAPGVVGFRHPLFAEAAYADLSPTRRATLHARLADTARDVLTPAELAHHYGRSRNRGADHLHWTLEAAEDATRRFAFADALTHLDRAADLLTDPARELATHLRRMALLQITVGIGSDAVAEAASRAHVLLARAEDRPELATTLWTLGELACNRADFPLAVDLSHRLLALGGDPLTRTAAHYLLGVAAYFTGRLADAEDHLTTAVDHLDERLLRGQTGRTPTLAVHEFRALVRSLRGLDAQPDLTAARALAERIEDPYGRANAELFAGWAALQEHDVPAVERAARECRRIGARGHMTHFVTTGDFFAEWAALRRGDATGPGAARAAADGIYRLGLRATRTITVAALAEALLVTGHHEQAAALADEGLRTARAVGEHVLTAELHRVRGLASGDAHDLDTGRAIARQQGAHLLSSRFH